MGGQLEGDVEWNEFAVVYNENLVGLSLEVTLMEEERRRKKIGSRVRGERVSGGVVGRERRNKGSAQITKIPLPHFFVSQADSYSIRLV